MPDGAGISIDLEGGLRIRGSKAPGDILHQGPWPQSGKARQEVLTVALLGNSHEPLVYDGGALTNCALVTERDQSKQEDQSRRNAMFIKWMEKLLAAALRTITSPYWGGYRESTRPYVRSIT